MAALFEKFVLNFYKKELTNYETKADRFPWQRTTGSSESMSRLPEMRLDVGLRSSDHFIVLDTKFYAEAMQSHHGNLRVNAGNIYQLFAYMKNLELRLDPDIQVDGVLLYPAVREHFSLRYEMHGHEVLVQSVDLTQDWRYIHDDLISLPGLFRAAPHPLPTH
jgi:5-methylcytosine-specific restriction enzyme subunit McrC